MARCRAERWCGFASKLASIREKLQQWMAEQAARATCTCVTFRPLGLNRSGLLSRQAVFCSQPAKVQIEKCTNMICSWRMYACCVGEGVRVPLYTCCVGEGVLVPTNVADISGTSKKGSMLRQRKGGKWRLCSRKGGGVSFVFEDGRGIRVCRLCRTRIIDQQIQNHYFRCSDDRLRHIRKATHSPFAKRAVMLTRVVHCSSLPL